MTVSRVQSWAASWGTPDSLVTTPPVNHSLNIGVSNVTSGHWLVAFIALHTVSGISATASVADDACSNWTPLVASPLVPPTSTAINPNPSFETGTTTGWNAVATSLSVVTNEAYDGTHSCKITPTGASTTAGIQTNYNVITANQYYAGSMWVYSPSGYAGLRPFLSWATSSTVFISATLGSTTTIQPGVWTQLLVTGQAPANAGNVVFGFSMLNGPQTWDILYADLGTLTATNGYSGTTRVVIWAAPNVRSGITNISISPLGQVNAAAVVLSEMSGLPNWLDFAPVSSTFTKASTYASLSVTPTQSSLILTAGADNATKYLVERVRGTWSGTVSTAFTNGVDANADLDLLTTWQVSSSPATVIYYGVAALNANSIFQSSTTGWQVVGGTAVFSSGVGLTGHSALLTPNGTSANVDFSVTHATAPAVTPSYTYVANLWGYTPNTSSVNAQVGIEWLNSSRTTISTTYSASIAIPHAQFYNQVIEAVAPANAAFASVHVRLPGTPPAGHQVNVVEAAISQVTNAVSGASFIHPVDMAAAMVAVKLTPGNVPTQPNSSWPYLKLECAFGQGAGTAPELLTWTDISNRLFSADTNRGRQYELNALQAAQNTFVLRNDDGFLTPGNSAPGALKVQVYTPYRLSAIWSGRQYDICVGYMERWPQTWADAHYGLVPTTGVDAWAMMTRTLQSVVRSEILVDQPLHYWPLGDPAGNSSAANLGIYNNTLPVVTSAFGVSSSKASFGASNLALVGDGGSNWSLVGLKSSAPQAAFGYTLSYPGAGLPSLSTLTSNANTITFWLYVPNAGPITVQTVNVFTALGTIGPMIAIQVTSAGLLQVVTWDVNTGASTTATTSYNVVNAKTLIALKMITSGWSLYANGSQVGGSAANLDSFWRSFEFAGRSDNYFTGLYGNMSLSHIAIFNRPLPSSRLITYYFAGVNGMAGDFSDWRISRYISYLLWAPPQRIYSDASTSQLSGATDIGGQDIGTAINNVAQTTQALQYVDRNGNITYRTRRASTNRGIQAVFGENSSEIPYQVTLEIDYDPQYVNNDIQVTHKGTPIFSVTSSATATTTTVNSSNITILVRNPASINTYGDHSLAATSYFSAISQSIDLANYLLNQYSNPLMRVAQIEVEASHNPTTFSTLLGLDIGDRVTVNRRPIGASAISLDVTIIGIHHSIEFKSGKWTISFDLMPTSIASLQVNTLKLNDPVLGKLDSGNVAGW